MSHYNLRYMTVSMTYSTVPQANIVIIMYRR